MDQPLSIESRITHMISGFRLSRIEFVFSGGLVVARAIPDLFHPVVADRIGRDLEGKENVSPEYMDELNAKALRSVALSSAPTIIEALEHLKKQLIVVEAELT
jgi:hypothetical protein